MTCAIILLFLAAFSTSVLQHGEIYWLDEEDFKITSINVEYVLLGKIKEACENGLQKLVNDLQVENVIGREVYYNKNEIK